MIALLAGVSGAWADVLNLTPSNGTYVTSSGNYVNSISFSTSPAITVTASANNMDKRQTSTYLLWHSGSSGSSTYTISAGAGYIITAYSVTGEANTSAQTLTAGAVSHEFAVGASSSFEVTGLNASPVSFVQTGENSSGLKITSISVTVEKEDWAPSFEDGSYLTVGDKVSSFTAATAADDNDHWYVLTQVRGGETPMYNTSAAASNIMRAGGPFTLSSLNGELTSTNSAYLIRFKSVGEGTYNIQFANGYWIDGNLNAVNLNSSAGTYAFYNCNGGSGSYFAWNLNSKSGSIVDNNGAGYNLAFWGSGEVNASSGNNVWYMYEATVEVPASTIDVTYAQYVNGVETGLTHTETVLPNSDINVPSNFYEGYSSLAYDYSTTGTIAEEDVTIRVNIDNKTGLVDDLSNLSNTKAYTIKTVRGTFTVNDGGLANTCKGAYAINNFAIIYYESNYYLWSVSESKFAQCSGTTLGISPVAITLTNVANGMFKIQGNGNTLNSTTGFATGGAFDSWSTTDDGNKCVIIEAADFDPTDAIEALTNYAPSVVSNIKPFFDAAGDGLFQLKTSVETAYHDMYIAALTICNSSTYATLLDVVNDRDNFNLPENGKYYIVKNVSNNKYLNVCNNGRSAGLLYANLDVPTAASVVKVRIDGEGYFYHCAQGKEFSWAYGNYSNYEAFLEDGGKHAHYKITIPGQVAFEHALGHGEGEYASYANTGYYQLNGSAGIVGGAYTGATAQWTFEEVASISVSLNSDGAGSPTYYATLCLPYDVTISGADAYTLTESGSWLVPSAVENNEVPAGTPVLLKSTSGATATATFNTGEAFNGGSPLDCALTGTYLAKEISGANDYVLGKDEGGVVGFYHWDSNNLGTNRAYVAAGASVKGYAINWDDVDAIKSLVDVKPENRVIYNIAGQRVDKLQRGVNIVNGKKVIVK